MKYNRRRVGPGFSRDKQYAMAFDPSDEIVLGVAAESRDAEVRIFRQNVRTESAVVRGSYLR